MLFRRWCSKCPTSVFVRSSVFLKDPLPRPLTQYRIEDVSVADGRGRSAPGLKTCWRVADIPCRHTHNWSRTKNGSLSLTNSRRLEIFHQPCASFITLPGSGPTYKEYAERRILGFSMEQMYNVVSDVERYQDFLPWCQKSKVKIRKKGHVIADLEIGFPPLIEAYTSSVTLVKPHLIKAESTQGKLFNKLITTWKFNPGLKGKPMSCVVDFYVSFEFRSALTSQLANVFFNEVVRAMAGAFYNEAKNRYGAESVPSRKINIVASNGSDK